MRHRIEHTQVLIIGAGLSGLHSAYELTKKGIPCMLLEARDRLGGRILSQHYKPKKQLTTETAFDLGPSWFWPGQKRMQSLLEELGLQDGVFEQTEKGMSLYEDEAGKINQGINGVSMRGSYRIDGGMVRLVNTLAKRISQQSYLTHAQLNEISYQGQTISAKYLLNNQTHTISCDFIVLATPPRIALQTIAFDPPLDTLRVSQLKTIATWMAGHAKVVVLYKHAFWHEQGFSGDVISHLGPLQEIHDASTLDESTFALFGFVGVVPDQRRDKEALCSAVIKQLVRLFGEVAATPVDIFIKDWAFDAYTSTSQDRQQMMFHPSNNLETTLESEWDNRLIFSGTETACLGERNNGYLEGALESSERTVSYLSSRINTL